MFEKTKKETTTAYSTGKFILGKIMFGKSEFKLHYIG